MRRNLSKIVCLTTVVAVLGLTTWKAQAALLVSSSTKNSILRYDETTGAFIDAFVPSGSGGLNLSDGVAFGPDNNLYVSSFNNNSVLRYNGETGAFIDAFVPSGSGGLVGPTDLVFGPDNSLYVSSEAGDTPNSSSVLRYNGETGAFINAFVPPADVGLEKPLGLAFGPDNNVYVASLSSNSVLRYNGETGAFIDSFVSPGSGELNRPAGLAFGPDNNLYVSSYLSNSVLRYNGETGAFIDSFVSPGSGGLELPAGLRFGPDNNLYVNSYNTNSVLHYNGETGAFIDAFVPPGSGGLSNPNLGLTFSPTPVPEPSFELGILAFGAFSLGSVLKRKLQKQQLAALARSTD